MAHRARPTLPPHPRKPWNSMLDEDERSFLRHYTMAIRQLRERHSSERDQTSIHVSLITCVLFSCMELIRGHYKTGERLLQHGIKLLRDRNAQLKEIDGDGEVEDDWIRDALERLCVPAIQLGGPSLWNDDKSLNKPDTPNTLPTRIESLHDARLAVQAGPPLIFESILQARETLDRLLHAILDVGGQYYDLPCASSLSTQQNLKTKLSSWHMTFLASRVRIYTQHGTVGIVAYQMLDRYYNMTYIMLETYTRPGDQMAFDAYTDQFLSIVRISRALYDSILVKRVLAGTPYDHRKDLATFVADRGWIMPLYYTATKCRVHPVRMQAIELLEKSYTREGVWDSKLAAAIAREIVKIEECGLYIAWDVDNSWVWDDDGEDQHASLPILPNDRRLHESRIDLPEDPWDKTVVHCRRKLHDGTEEILTKVYDPAA